MSTKHTHTSVRTWVQLYHLHDPIIAHATASLIVALEGQRLVKSGEALELHAVGDPTGFNAHNSPLEVRPRLPG